MWPEAIPSGARRPADRLRPARPALAARIAIVGGLALAGWIAAALLTHAADAAVTDTDEVALTEAGGGPAAGQRYHRQIVDEVLRGVSRLVDAPDEQAATAPEAPAADTVRRHRARHAEPPARLPDPAEPDRRADRGDRPTWSLMDRGGLLTAESLLRALDDDLSGGEADSVDDAAMLWRTVRMLADVSRPADAFVPVDLRPVVDAAVSGDMTVSVPEPMGGADAQVPPAPSGGPVAPGASAQSAASPPGFDGAADRAVEATAPPEEDASSSADVGLEPRVASPDVAVQPAVHDCRSCRTKGEPPSPLLPFPIDRPAPADVSSVSGGHAQLPLAGIFQAQPLKAPRDSGFSAVPYVALQDMIAVEDLAAVPD
ncbi:hypothetical protein Arub01_02530 [Actinomadura rubrobrunea]|uniref:Uncharacterized protein n=2 Tax=Actinomadura rubrobrunea TaxID=115335 RepID=A0A9W6PP03_9ACTN|nr:hypothetical protein [Actinomadura rubrobrunea]GLW62009.1 hypothetical protein Arub01_02530 [Actinomadura rubrobrunea]